MTVELQPHRCGMRVRYLPYLTPESSSVLPAPFHCLAFPFTERAKPVHDLSLIHSE